MSDLAVNIVQIKQKNNIKELLKKWGLPLAVFVTLLMVMTPVPAGLNVQGYRIIIVLVFMLILWITESVSYPVSSIYLIVSMALLMGFSIENGKLITTSQGLAMALSGFSTTAWVLVVAALFISAAFDMTGLGKRISLTILSYMGANTKDVLLGFILMSFILSLFIPAQAANAALMTAIAVGVVQTFNIDRKGNLAKGLLLSVAFSTGIAGMGILTSGAPPIQTAKFISDVTGVHIGWLQWSMYGMPFAISVAAVLYLLILKLFPPEIEEMEGGRDRIKEHLKQLGPITASEKKLLLLMSITIFLWATGDKFHKIDNSSVALLAVAAILFPGFKIAKWQDLAGTVNWGTLMLFGGAISLGTYMLKTGASAWIATNSMDLLQIAQWPKLAIVAAGIFTFSIFALAFSARSAAVSALIPTAIGFAQSLGGIIPVWGLTLILYFPIQFSIILPVNTPMSMVAYSTDTFSSSDMLKIAVPLVCCAMILALIFAATYWNWIGLI